VPRFSAKPFVAGSEQARYDEITAVLEDSVAKHMRADVTVGAFLSGGIDSTAIAALAIRHNPRLITFTTGFEREGFSEVDVAIASADAIGARHVAKVVSPAEFVEALPEIVWYLDEPVADPALVPLYFIAREARKHVKVVLSGEGADELFGGYTIYREPLSLKPFEYLPGRLRRSMRKVSAPLPDGLRGKSLLHRGSLTLEERYYGNARSFSDPQLRAVLRGFRDEWTHTDVTASLYTQSRNWCRSSIPRSLPSPRGCRWSRRSPAPPRNTRCGARWRQSCQPMCSIGRNWASLCRSGTGCRPVSCSTGRTRWSPTRKPTSWWTSPPSAECSTNTSPAQAITADDCGRC
jgi:asparagine synthetase B (glutamine-hydrolysing)